MTPEQQRIAIAEACGWTCGEDGHWKDSNGHYAINQRWSSGMSIPPDYLDNLNAMHEAEEALSFEQGHEYAKCCYNLSAHQTDGKPAGYSGYLMMIRATAAQRAEAFLRTIGKWKGEAK